MKKSFKKEKMENRALQLVQKSLWNGFSHQNKHLSFNLEEMLSRIIFAFAILTVFIFADEKEFKWSRWGE